MIKAQLASWKTLPAVLAAMSVSSKQIPPVHPERCDVLPIETHKPDDSRHLNVKRDGADPIDFVPFFLGPQLA
jgi:hypothetical protein